MERCGTEKTRGVGSWKLEKGAGRPRWMKAEVAPAQERAAQSLYFSVRFL